MTGVRLPPRPVKGKRGRGVTGVSTFESAAFEGELTEAKFQPDGSMRVVLVIPEHHREEAKKLGDAFSCALEVVVRKRSLTDDDT